MGHGGSKAKSRKKSKKVPMNIPPDSPLGLKLSQSNYNPDTRGKDKIKMMQYCMIEWTKEEIRPDHVHWPEYGSFEKWICQALQMHGNAEECFSREA